MAKAAAWPSVMRPSVRPAMKLSISCASSANPSRFLRMISCGRNIAASLQGCEQRIEQARRAETEMRRRHKIRAHDVVRDGEIGARLLQRAQAAGRLEADLLAAVAN